MSWGLSGIMLNREGWGRGGIGRRSGLKIRWGLPRAGSSPAVPTIAFDSLHVLYLVKY